ncbi:glycosyl transferase family 1 [Neisseria gonorrhoeae]|nr:glycosyl transferase family 1 [Neisseria gonorrhoeae]ASQ74695.1 glycosyl transferase family 1 [Neisseria gonorrhoeae]KDN03853.1 glycosyl transferase family 1 [Neisseria gonorrhoeae]OOD37655.1 glycosyl transferase family 1 [Neisseria gonorrhoeae]OZV74702.1 glycosyl transferase family 1 [Neisseria gonorrhoeae]
MFHFGPSSFVVGCSFGLFPNKLPYKFLYTRILGFKSNTAYRFSFLVSAGVLPKYCLNA